MIEQKRFHQSSGDVSQEPAPVPDDGCRGESQRLTRHQDDTRSDQEMKFLHMKCDFMFRIGKRDPSLGPSWSEGNLRYEARCIDLRTRQAGYRQPSSGPCSQTRMVHLRVPHRQTDRRAQNMRFLTMKFEFHLPILNLPLVPNLTSLKISAKEETRQG